MGFAIRAAQEGSKSADASPLKGALREVVEVRENDEAGTHRLMYTVSLGDAVYVLDFFQKKSKSGIATPKIDVDRITERLAPSKTAPCRIPEGNLMSNESAKIVESSGNVFVDLGLQNADELLAKADLAIAIKKEIDAQGWTQAQAAERVFMSQPKISKLLRMKLDDFSRDRLQEVLRNLESTSSSSCIVATTAASERYA